jgi:tRNA threonylcarbamoyladenosine biosynthesis protein TsaB
VLLAIDTSTAVASVALYDEKILFESTWIAGQDHSRQLLPRVAEALNAIGRSVGEIRAVGVALGPGSFNGLRVGIATAKAICLANCLPIIGIETLVSTAYQFRLIGRPIRPLYPAGRDELATGLYQAQGELFLTLEEPRHATIAQAVGESPPDVYFCGELKPAWIEAIRADPRFADGIWCLPRPAAAFRRAGYLAELAWQRWQAGLVDDVATLQPLYLRRPMITLRAGAIGGGAS